jgi:hypothetical protein
VFCVGVVAKVMSAAVLCCVECRRFCCCVGASVAQQQAAAFTSCVLLGRLLERKHCMPAVACHSSWEVVPWKGPNCNRGMLKGW